MSLYYIGLPFLMIVAVVDATFMKIFQIWGGAPNLMLMVIVSWALITELEEALPWAVMGGIMRDLLSVAPTGTSALAFIIIVVAIDIVFPPISWRNVIIAPLVVFGSTFMYDGVLLIFLIVAGYTRPILYGFLYFSLPAAVENLLMVLFVFRTMGSINAFLRPQRTSMFE